jgi:hypothetical protein
MLFKNIIDFFSGLSMNNEKNDVIDSINIVGIVFALITIGLLVLGGIYAFVCIAWIVGSFMFNLAIASLLFSLQYILPCSFCCMCIAFGVGFLFNKTK